MATLRTAACTARSCAIVRSSRTAAAPPKVAASKELTDQLRLQNEAAHALREARGRLGALTFDRQETLAVIENGHVKGIEPRRANRASRLIEDFMIGSNEVM